MVDRKKVVLIIDDDVDCSLYLENRMRHTDYKVVLAYTAVDGLDYLKKEACDVVLLDIFLPDLTGVEVAQRIRSMKGNLFPIIGITCVPIDELQSLFSKDLNYFTDICIKPLGFETVIEMLQENTPTLHRKTSKMDELTQNYQASISDRLELLRALIFEFEKLQNEKSLTELRLQVHRLAGSAGLFGYHEVSRICKEFDRQLGDDISLYRESTDLTNQIINYHSMLKAIRTAFSIKKSEEKSELENKIIHKKAIIGVIGLGNIGLALLDSFGKVGFSLIGFDINNTKIDMLKRGESYLNYMDMDPLFKIMKKGRFNVSADPTILKEADVLIISVPTSIDRYGTPNLSNLRAAFQTVLSVLKKHQLVILQSSTYPGTTEEELLPILMKSKLSVGIDFYLAHVPEIADIGNEQFNFVQVPRIVSGVTPACLKYVSLIYQNISSKIIPCSSPRIAESAKLLQNAFRLVNISFINEMKELFDTMNIDVWEVISAASSKPFGFMPFYPSPGIGGDCIPIAPFYLVWKAKATGGPATMLEDAGRINNSMPQYVIKKLIYGLNLHGKTIRGAKILILGVSYKKDVNDMRESAALKILPILNQMLADVDYHDPYIKKITNFIDHPKLSFESIELNNTKLHTYDAVMILTDHTSYCWEDIIKHSHLIIDTRNVSSHIIDQRKIIKA